MDGRDDESDAGDRGEVPWELDFTLARVRRPRLLRPTRAARARAQAETAAPAAPGGGEDAGAVPAAPPAARAATEAATAPDPEPVPTAAPGPAPTAAPGPVPTSLPPLPPGVASGEDTVRLTEGVPAALREQPFPQARGRETAPGSGSGAAASGKAARDGGGARGGGDPRGGGAAERRRNTGRRSRARAELAVKVTCGVALVGGTAALVALALVG